MMNGQGHGEVKKNTKTMTLQNGHLNGVDKNDAAEITSSTTTCGASDCVEGFANIQERDTAQYLNNYKAHRTGISHEEMVQVYTDWANNYDQV
jgi:hypothetical protein